MKLIKSYYLLIFIIAIYTQSGFSQREIDLQEAIKLALNTNPGIKAAKSQIEEAEAKTLQAKSSFLPKANVISKYMYSNNLPNFYPLLGVDLPIQNESGPTDEHVTLHPMAPYPDLNRDIFTFDYNMMYPVYTGHKRQNAVKLTKFLKKAYNENLKETKASIILKIKSTFYNYLMINSVISVYKDALKQLNEHLKLAEKAKEEGMRSEFDVLNFKSKIEGFKSEIINFEGKKKIVETALKNLTDLNIDENVVFTGNITEKYKEILAKEKIKLDSIIDSNYKLNYLDNMKKVLNKKIDIRKADQLPVIFAFGNYHIYHGMDFPPFDKTWRSGYAIGMGVKIDLFDGNMSKAQIKEIKATDEKLSNYEDGLKLKLRIDYEKAIETIKSLKSRKKAQETHLKVAEKAYEIAKIAYENGVITNIELNDAQLNLTKIKTSILNFEKEILIQYANLEYMNGIFN